MSVDLDDTIAALASAPGSAVRGIVRLSGPDVRPLLLTIFEPNDASRFNASPTAACHPGWISVSQLTQRLPVSVYLWPRRSSYTGQPSAEIHTIGSPPLLEAILAELFQRKIRPALPGEFTLRAFLSGRVDLVQAEAVLGVVDATAEKELEAALSQLAGGISGKIARLRSDLVNLLADLEAGLDFVEEDIEFVSKDELIERLNAAARELATLVEQATMRMQSKARRRVVLAGLPNAGKSTLFNALLKRKAALVSEMRGTTRDYLCADVNFQGVSLELVDTAGWESTPEGIMQQAQDLKDEQLAHADLIVWCTAADLDDADRKIDSSCFAVLKQQGRTLVPVTTKADIRPPGREQPVVSVSALSGAGIPELVEAVVSAVSNSSVGRNELIGTTAARCRESLVNAIGSLGDAQSTAADDRGHEIVAIEIREALEPLGRIVGAVYTDDILDQIFSRFCIGK